MLSEDALENLVQPVIDRQEQISLYVITQIARVIKEIGEIPPSYVYRLERLLKSGGDVLKINKEIARLAALQVEDIKKIIRTAAKDIYLDVKPFYDYREKPFIPFDKNEELQKVVSAIAEQTGNTYKNLSKAQAFMLRDPKNPKNLVPTPVSKAYQSVIDEAVQANKMSGINYNTAIRRSLQQLVDSGLRKADYQAESGKYHSQRLDTAVRRNVLDGIRAVNQRVQDETGKQIGTDGIELSVHNFPAPDHAHVQGHRFTNAEYDKMNNGKDFVDVNGTHFDGFPRAIGVLNCRHLAFSVILSASTPNYSQEELDKILAKNKKGYTFPDGKHLTMYECTQEQRRLETAIRHAKDGAIAAREAGDDILENKYRAKVAKYTKQYKAFSNACGLSPKNGKTYVKGYGHKKAVDKSGKSDIIKENDKFIISSAKIDKFLLKPGAKHSNEFFDVGYTPDDGERLFKDIELGFDETKAWDIKQVGADRRFSITMKLGITQQKDFQTVWMQDANGGKPRFITAHRVRKK